MRLNTTGQDESLLGNDLPLYAIDHYENPRHLVHAVAHNVDRAQTVPDPRPSDDKAEYAPSTTVKMIQSQKQDAFCRTAPTKVEQRNCEITVNEKGLLVRKAHIVGAIHIGQHPSLRQRVLMVSHYPPNAGHCIQRRMYGTLRRPFYGPYMAPDVAYIERNCASCPRNNSKYRFRRNMQLF